MKKRVADYFGEYLVSIGINTDFTVPGGGAMHLDDAFAHTEGMKCVFVQHEQSAAIAAEAYARLNKQIPLVCVTTGPGGTNTLTGVVGAWLDSIPMLIISGQVRYATTARYAGIPVRAMGDQEFDITKVVAPMTKYAEMITDAKMAMYHLEKALFLAKNGRPGPSWIDVPLDIQSALMDENDFVHFDPIAEGYVDKFEPVDSDIERVIKLICESKRPVLNAGNGIRIAEAQPEFIELVNLLNIPVVTGWDSIDLIEDEKFYIKTENVDTSCGFVFLAHKNERVLRNDINFLRSVEKNAFDLILSEELDHHNKFNNDIMIKKLKLLVDASQNYGNGILITDQTIYDVDILQIGIEDVENVDGEFDYVIINLNRSIIEKSDYFKVDLILKLMSYIKVGGYIFIPETTYRFIPGQRKGIELLLKALDLRIEVPPYGPIRGVIASKS